MSLSRLNWCSACRTMVRETWKMSAIFCSASLVPGISRRSTMAVVIDSMMRWAVSTGAPRCGRHRARNLLPCGSEGWQGGRGNAGATWLDACVNG